MFFLKFGPRTGRTPKTLKPFETVKSLSWTPQKPSGAESPYRDFIRGVSEK